MELVASKRSVVVPSQEAENIQGAHLWLWSVLQYLAIIRIYQCFGTVVKQIELINASLTQQCWFWLSLLNNDIVKMFVEVSASSWRGRCHQRWVMEQKHEAMRIVCRYLKWVVLNPDGIMWNWNINMYTFFMLTDICQYLQPRLLFIVVNKRWIYAQSCTVAQTCSQLDVGCSILAPQNFIVVPCFPKTVSFLCWFYFSEKWAIDKNVSDDGKSLLHIFYMFLILWKVKRWVLRFLNETQIASSQIDMNMK